MNPPNKITNGSGIASKALMPTHHTTLSAVRPDGLSSPKVVQDFARVPVSNSAIAKRAYQKFLQRGSAHGSDKEDWAQARQELLDEKGNK